MPADPVHHDKFADQLILSLVRLDLQAFAAEFAMHVRTIKRDLKECFAFLLLYQGGDLCFLKTSCLDNCNLRDLGHFFGLVSRQDSFVHLESTILANQGISFTKKRSCPGLCGYARLRARQRGQKMVPDGQATPQVQGLDLQQKRRPAGRPRHLGVRSGRQRNPDAGGHYLTDRK